jgi:hypothetical protein
LHLPVDSGTILETAYGGSNRAPLGPARCPFFGVHPDLTNAWLSEAQHVDG